MCSPSLQPANMANGHVEIHDPLASRKDPNGAAEHKPTPEAVPDSLEYRMMRAYAQRRNRGNNNNNSFEWSGGVQLQGQMGDVGGPGGAASSPSSPATPSSPAKPSPTKPGKKRLKRLYKIFKCIRPQTDDAKEDAEEPQDPNNRCLHASAGQSEQRREEGGELEGGELETAAADTLIGIVNDISFAPPDLEADAPGDDVNMEKVIGLLLREVGDRHNERLELRDVLMATRLSWNYSFFERLIQTLLGRMGLLTPDPQAPGPQTSPKTQMAVTCEVATRLSAADTLPMNRLLGYGATYLQTHISPWAQQQGGYDAVFEDDGDDEGADDDDDEVQ